MQTIQDIIDKGGLSRREEASLYKNVVKSIVESLYLQGLITDEEMKDPKKQKEVVLSLVTKQKIHFTG